MGPLTVLAVNALGATPALLAGPGSAWFAALGPFALQFAFNVAWTPVFFGAQELFASLGIVLVLDVLVAATIWGFAQVDRRAAALLVPYLAWILFATALNYQFWALN